METKLAQEGGLSDPLLGASASVQTENPATLYARPPLVPGSLQPDARTSACVSSISQDILNAFSPLTWLWSIRMLPTLVMLAENIDESAGIPALPCFGILLTTCASMSILFNLLLNRNRTLFNSCKTSISTKEGRKELKKNPFYYASRFPSFLVTAFGAYAYGVLVSFPTNEDIPHYGNETEHASFNAVIDEVNTIRNLFLSPTNNPLSPKVYYVTQATAFAMAFNLLYSDSVNNKIHDMLLSLIHPFLGLRGNFPLSPLKIEQLERRSAESLYNQHYAERTRNAIDSVAQELANKDISIDHTNPQFARCVIKTLIAEKEKDNNCLNYVAHTVRQVMTLTLMLFIALGILPAVSLIVTETQDLLDQNTQNGTGYGNATGVDNEAMSSMQVTFISILTFYCFQRPMTTIFSFQPAQTVIEMLCRVANTFCSKKGTTAVHKVALASDLTKLLIFTLMAAPTVLPSISNTMTAFKRDENGEFINPFAQQFIAIVETALSTLLFNMYGILAMPTRGITTWLDNLIRRCTRSKVTSDDMKKYRDIELEARLVLHKPKEDFTKLLTRNQRRLMSFNTDPTSRLQKRHVHCLTNWHTIVMLATTMGLVMGNILHTDDLMKLIDASTNSTHANNTGFHFTEPFEYEHIPGIMLLLKLIPATVIDALTDKSACEVFKTLLHRTVINAYAVVMTGIILDWATAGEYGRNADQLGLAFYGIQILLVMEHLQGSSPIVCLSSESSEKGENTITQQNPTLNGSNSATVDFSNHLFTNDVPDSHGKTKTSMTNDPRNTGASAF